jgi:hypothetical protein
MKLNPYIYGIIVLLVFLGIIIGFQQAGVWSTSGKVDDAGQQVQPSTEDVNSIKGWMTLDQVSKTYNIPVVDILLAFDLPADTPESTAIKDLESETFDLPTLRTWLEEHQQPAP